MRFSRLALPALAAALAACGGKTGAAPGAPEPAARMPMRPLADVATRPLVVLPAHHLRPDTLGWSARIDDPRQYLRTLDDEIAYAIGERQVARQWAFARDVERSARRNAAYSPDPGSLALSALRPPHRVRPEWLNDPLASQLRSLVALHDARYALVPVELHFERAGEGTARAVLHLALIDARLSRVLWMTDVRSDPQPMFSRAVAANLAERLADLVAAAP